MACVFFVASNVVSVVDEVQAALHEELEQYKTTIPCFDWLKEIGEAKELQESCKQNMARYHTTLNETMLCLTLQKPDSKAFATRLLEYTAAISSKTVSSWEDHIQLAPLVNMIKDGMGASQSDEKEKKPVKDKRRLKKNVSDASTPSVAPQGKKKQKK